MSVEKYSFGHIPGMGDVSAYRIQNSAGMSAVVIDYGAALQSLCVRDSSGGFTDVVLGYATASEYASNDGCLGATVGRYANRLGGAEFSLGGVCFKLCKNDGENCLHGGRRGFDKYIWDAQTGDSYVRFSRVSPDGEENFPGNLSVSVTYTLTDDNALRISYDADTDADTVVNLTNHSYFNLRGAGDVLSQELMINAECITEIDSCVLPTGAFIPVDGTPFDFRMFKPIGLDIEADNEQLKFAGGYDHNFVLSGRHAASARCPESGVRMDVYTTSPGMQLYTANFLTDRAGKNGARYAYRGGFCLETGLFANAMRCYGFPSPVLRKGQHMHSETVFSFSLIR